MQRRGLIGAALAVTLSSPARAASSSPVVLELFTSQGCSSCPPADRLLGELARRPSVIALAWHVDYWNRLGWQDPFASRLATERQTAYARQLSAEVYTPALVVSGRNIVVGSDRIAVERAIGAAPRLAVPVAISRAADGLVVDVGATSGSVRAIRAVYDLERATDIGAGENQGERLHEFRIVRDAAVLDEWDGSPRRFTLPSASTGQGVAVLLQTADLQIVGAADRPLT
jgi:hypothetical protein